MPSRLYDYLSKLSPRSRKTESDQSAQPSIDRTRYNKDRNLVISTMKDEGPYLLEWVAWYRTIGFTDILVYTNGCTDGTDLMLQRLEQLGVLKHEYNNVLRRGPHKSALKHAMAHPLYAEADWAFVGDVDEFLNIHVGQGHINDLKATHPDADVIPVVWRLFSSNGEIEIHDGMITERMTDAAPLPDGETVKKVGFIKTFFRVTDHVERLGLHRPFFKEGTNEKWSLKPPSDDDPLRLIGDLGQDVAQLNHYAVRSAKSFIIKRDRGRANHTTNRIGPDYWARWNAGGAPDGSILRNHAAHRAEYDRLLQDPILAAMHKAALEVHSARANDILQNDAEARGIFELITQAQSAPVAAPAPAPETGPSIPVSDAPPLTASPTIVEGPQPQAQPQAKPQPQPQAQAQPQAQPQTAAPAQNQAEAQAHVQAKIQARMQAHAEQKARVKARAENQQAQNTTPGAAAAARIKKIPIKKAAVPQELPPQTMATPEEAEQIIQGILAESDLRRRAPKRRQLRQKMLTEDIPKGGRAAEIGVWQGTFSAEILNITRPRELVLIDPWDLLAKKEDEHTHSQHAQANQMRAKYLQVATTLGRLPNCVIRKGFSAEVLETYPDNYFDWVYIDGNHLYDFVLKDILISARKVRPGGVIAGDDLYWKKDGQPHVLNAVRDAMVQLGDGAKQTRRGAQFIIKLAE